MIFDFSSASITDQHGSLYSLGQVVGRQTLFNQVTCQIIQLAGTQIIQKSIKGRILLRKMLINNYGIRIIFLSPHRDEIRCGFWLLVWTCPKIIDK